MGGKEKKGKARESDVSVAVWGKKTGPGDRHKPCRSAFQSRIAALRRLRPVSQRLGTHRPPLGFPWTGQADSRGRQVGVGVHGSKAASPVQCSTRQTDGVQATESVGYPLLSLTDFFVFFFVFFGFLFLNNLFAHSPPQELLQTEPRPQSPHTTHTRRCPAVCITTGSAAAHREQNDGNDSNPTCQ